MMRVVRILDIVIILIAFSLVVGSILFLSRSRQGTLYVEVEAVNETHYLPLSMDNRLTVKGPVGNTVIEVKNGRVYVEDSDCRDKICMAMGEVSRASGWIACLPNKVFLLVVTRGSSEESAVDAGAY